MSDDAAVLDTHVAEPIDTPDPEPADAVDTPDAGAEPEGAEPTATGEQQPTPTPGEPGKFQSSEVAKYLRGLRTADPANAKLARYLGDTYFRAQEYEKAFPSVEEARNARIELDAIGGLEEAKEAVEFIRDLDEKFAAGDPELVNQLARDNPDGFRGLAAAGLNKLAETNQRAYNEVLRPHLVQALADTNLQFALDTVAGLLQAGNAELAGQYLGNIQQFLQSLQATAGRTGTTPGAAPGGAAAGQPTQQSSGGGVDYASLQAAVMPKLTATIEAALKPLLAQRQLKDSARARVVGLVQHGLDQALGADAGYQRTLGLLSRLGDVGRMSGFIISKAEQSVGRIAREVLLDLFEDGKPTVPARAQAARPAAKPAAQQAFGKPTDTGKPAFVGREPGSDTIDWSRDPRKLLFITNKAFLKDGRYVTWK